MYQFPHRYESVQDSYEAAYLQRQLWYVYDKGQRNVPWCTIPNLKNLLVPYDKIILSFGQCLFHGMVLSKSGKLSQVVRG